MAELIDVGTWRIALGESLSAVGSVLARFLPALAGACAILLVGWLVARALQAATARVLHGTGLDRTAARLQISGALAQGGFSGLPSQMLARLVFWVVLALFAIPAIDVLGFTATAADSLDRALAFVPRLLAAALLLLAGVVIGRLLRNVVASGAAATRIAYASRLGALTQSAIVAIAAVVALGQLGVDTGLLVTVITAVLAAFGLTMGVTFSLGARPVVSHILAGHYLRQSLPPGRRAVFSGRSGVVERVGPVATLFRSEERTFSVPNARLLEEIVEH